MVIGAGRVGQSLAAALSAAGRDVAVSGRDGSRPSFLEAHPAVRYRTGPPSGEESDLRTAPTLVFCVPDDMLSAAAEAWSGAAITSARADRSPSGPGGPSRASRGVALHTSGVHDAGVLAPLRPSGLALGAFHPLTALSEPRADAFRGVTFAVEGDPTAARRARELAREAGARTMALEAGAHPRYHAAAVFASNHLVACLAVAARELAAATGGEGSLRDLLPLARAAVESLEGKDLSEGATGPLVRGDVGTVRRHLRALPPETAALYRGLARELLSVVEGRLEEPTAEEMRRALDPLEEADGEPAAG